MIADRTLRMVDDLVVGRVQDRLCLAAGGLLPNTIHVKFIRAACSLDLIVERGHLC